MVLKNKIAWEINYLKDRGMNYLNIYNKQLLI